MGASKIARDITERKSAEKTLLESEGMARGIIDTALDVFIQMDEGGHVIGWNPQVEEIFGWSRVRRVPGAFPSSPLSPAISGSTIATKTFTRLCTRSYLVRVAIDCGECAG